MRIEVQSPIGKFFLGLIFAVVGSTLGYFEAWPNFQSARESHSWPITTGKVLVSEVQQHVQHTTNHSGTINLNQSSKKITYKANIIYSYSIEGRTYQSGQVYAGNEGAGYGGSTEASSYASKYPVGKEVTVYYSPKSESNAVLEPGVNGSHYMLLGMSVLFALIGFGVMFSGLFKSKVPELKHRKKHSRQEIGEFDETALLKKEAPFTSPYEEPWKFQWVIKGANKSFGPYSYEMLLELFEKGKVNENHECYPSAGGYAIKVGVIIHKKAG